MHKFYILTIVLMVALATGCSINHPVAKEYDQHLVKYGQETVLPKVDMEAEYIVADETKNHSYQFRAATVGYAHVWIVEFGAILDKTIQADYVQSAFGKLEKSSGGSESERLIAFELESFEFENYRAYASLNIKVMQSGQQVFNKTYRSAGSSQGGQMWMGGPFAMKNATLKSTKSSVDKILEQFINDLNAGVLASK
ncbi:hypothetical protein [Oceanicoccus sp. KOV_DT_Chl]|uniref:hypothetical protein n=1 Tax=Oceanicoccus sp. KOV_DT_Chl TaxID=1904639 RepID=UPI000C7DF23C|nr:hypothetical protein [Oceanicoccus sp. KOV_DT_Chl]